MLPPIRQLSHCSWTLVFTILWLLSLRLNSDFTQQLERSGIKVRPRWRRGGGAADAFTAFCRRHVTSKGEICVSHLVMVVRKEKKKKNCVAAAMLNNERLHAVADSDGKPREEFRASHPACFIILSQSIKVRLCCLSTRNRSSALWECLA